MEKGRRGQVRKMAERWATVLCIAEREEETRKGVELITYRARHFRGSPRTAGGPHH